MREPEVYFGTDVYVPDLVAWRRERMPQIPDAQGFTLVPDWACEVVSPYTARLDRGRKLLGYARHGVDWVWVVDPGPQVVEVFHRTGEHLTWTAAFERNDTMRAEPFETLEIQLADLWRYQ
ncbi:MAG: hypothetical protein QOH21_3738 [Acidobacteriota bacterium]|nr:hypothetical protein [Acidobacteriota bacterium]